MIGNYIAKVKIFCRKVKVNQKLEKEIKVFGIGRQYREYKQMFIYGDRHSYGIVIFE
jgi:hypothetical protein